MAPLDGRESLVAHRYAVDGDGPVPPGLREGELGGDVLTCLIERRQIGSTELCCQVRVLPICRPWAGGILWRPGAEFDGHDPHAAVKGDVAEQPLDAFGLRAAHAAPPLT